jgi:hypothetical protein
MATPTDPLNPYAPPKASILEAAPAGHEAFVAEGQKVAPGRGVTWFGEAWRLFMGAPGIWIAVFVIFMLMTLVLAIIPLGSLVSSLLYPVFTAGLMLGCRELDSGGKLELAHLFAGFKKNAGNLILVGLLYLVGVVVIGIIVGIAAALAIPLLVPGGALRGDFSSMMVMVPLFLLGFLVMLALMLPLIMAIWFAPALVIFHDLQPMAAMKASFAGCLKNIVPFLIYGLVGLGLAILAAIPFGLGFLVYGPVVWASMYTGYRDIYMRHG